MSAHCDAQMYYIINESLIVVFVRKSLALGLSLSEITWQFC